MGLNNDNNEEKAISPVKVFLHVKRYYPVTYSFRTMEAL